MSSVPGSDGFVPGERFVVSPAGSGALDGLRFAAKDLIDVAGHRTGGGNPDWLAAAVPAPRHAAAIAMLLAAGASCVGKTITDELAFSLEGENVHYGAPTNPANPAWLPGGSSSGSAVAVASGAVEFALGTDTGGSVRVPAAFCRIFGFRPSHGAVSLEGVLPFAPSYDTVGWFARDASVLEEVGKVLLPPSPSDPIQRIRLAAYIFGQIDAEVARDIAEAARSVITAPPVDLLGGHSLEYLQRVYSTVQGYEIRLALGERLATLQPRFGAAIAERFATALRIGEAEYHATIEARGRFATCVARNCPPDTAIVMPVTSVRFLARGVSQSALGAFYAKTLGLTAIAGHGGMPQVQLGVRAGSAAVGFALLGARGADRALLQLAARISSNEKNIA